MSQYSFRFPFGATSMAKATILIVDDHAVFRNSLRQALKKLSFAGEIIEAEGGTSAIQLANEHAPDLIFMDIIMPGITGIEAARRILSEKPGTRIIMVIANASRALQQESLDAGALGYLVKKDIHTELGPAVEKVMDDRQFVSESARFSSG